VRVCIAAAEATPFAKTGGLGDAVAGLTRYLARAGHDARLFLPFYGAIATLGRGFEPVGFAQDVPVALGPHRYAFSLWTAPLPGPAGDGPPVYFVHCPPLYDRPSIYTERPDEPIRFGFFARAVLESCQRMGWAPEILHCHDWHSALAPLYLRTHYSWDGLFAGTRALLTIHNVGYQGVFGEQAIAELDLGAHRHLLASEDRAEGTLNFLRTGIVHSGALSTVSPRHAQEIQTTEYGAGLEGLLRYRSGDLVGILNGVDEEWDPATDALLPARYSRDDLAGKSECKRTLVRELGLPHHPETPVLGIVSRLTRQKGIDLFFEVLPDLLQRRDVQLLAVGSGEPKYEAFFRGLQTRFPHRVVSYAGYSNELAHRVEAGADVFLMPSLYEPCGLNQMYSQLYGTPPVVRATGGLADSVEPWDWVARSGTGFVFEHFTAQGLAWAIQSALDTFAHPESWRILQRNGMARDFSWHAQGEKYVDLYRTMIA
jgi:starch synthase